MNAVARLAAPDPMRAMTTETGWEPRSRSRARRFILLALGREIDAGREELSRLVTLLPRVGKRHDWIGPERQHVFAVVVRVLEPPEVDQRQHLLGDRHRAALEPDDVAGELLAGGRELGEHVLALDRVGVERRAVAVEVLDRDRLAVDHALPRRAVADEHHLLAGLRVDRPLICASVIRHRLPVPSGVRGEHLAVGVDGALHPLPCLLAVAAAAVPSVALDPNVKAIAEPRLPGGSPCFEKNAVLLYV